MKKSAKNVLVVKGHMKITNFFIKQEKLDVSSTSTEDLKDCRKSAVVTKRKGDDINTLSPPQKKKNIIFERELTPDRKPSISEQDKNAKPIASSYNSVISVKSPEQLLSAEALIEYYTPEKKFERFMDKIKSPAKKMLFNEDTIEKSKENHTLVSKVDEIIENKVNRKSTPKKRTPKESNNSANANQSNLTGKTPIKTKKTPKKLFDKSPNNVNEFNVQIIESFVKITPSKSQKNDPEVEFVSCSEKKQSSILKYISPTASAKSLEAKHRNELTPTKSHANVCNGSQSPSTKVKIKLNFSDCINEKPSSSKQAKISDSKVRKGNNKSLKLNAKEVSPEKCNNLDKGQENNVNIPNWEFSFSDEWNEEMLIPSQLEYKLDLRESQHCKIMNINAFPTKNVITLKSTKNGEQALCNLEGFWMHSQLNIGDTLHISAKKLNEVEWIVNNDYGLVVYEPDFLISATSVVNTLWCKRKSVLSDCFHGFDPANKAMLVGSLVHSLLQHVLKNKIHNQEEIEKIAKDLLKNRNTISSIYDCDLTIELIEEELMKYVPKIVSFIHMYVKDIQTKRQPNLKRNKEDWKGTINSIDDIEENIWCPELGIKGKVDVSVRTDHSLMPLEVKTGRASVSLEHRGQVLMYIMMMNKLGYEVPSGLLLYLKDGVLREIPPTQKEKRDIIIMRNELAYYLTRKPKIVEDDKIKRKRLVPPDLPEPINHTSCAKCPYNVICTAFAKYNNEDISSMKTLKNIQDEVFFYLDESHLNYFIHWVSLLALESNTKKGSKDLREIYTLPPEERESNGKCIINLKVSHIGKECNGVIEHTFVRIHDEPGYNFFSHGIKESNYVVVSVASRPAISAGFVTDITPNSITVTLDRDLNKKYRDQTFYIDSYDSSSIQSFNLTSLTLLLGLTDRAEKLRRIVVDKIPPTFKSRLPKVIGSKGKAILRRLNVVQQRAVLKAIAANDYFLIEGMPGTGKTATIVALIQLLVELGKSVLITSHTHSAVDNVCTRLVSYGVKLLRLGSESRIHPSLKDHSEYWLTKDCTTPEQLAEVYNSAQVVAVTCLGSGHPILSKRVMDICIVDESTQVVQSSVIRPLHSANTFILIGDPNQLPAVIRSRDAIEMGMSESLFERLYSKEAAIALNLNYRMNATITALANHVTYRGELKIGNDSVANASLKLPEPEALELTSDRWLVKALDESMENAVQFLDTGPVWNFQHVVPWRTHKSTDENGEGQSCANVYEAAVVFHLVKALLKAGIQSHDIGVIATFRAQVAQISLLLQTDSVDISTVDQFQGKDKNVIIYSSSKSRDVSVPKVTNKYEILEDKRRLTVAITRAKHKLIIVGDVSTLEGYSTFKQILPYVEANLIRLPETADFSWDKILDNVKI
ncbi:DNA replication ATP-dependent helicase/nuclease DNA2 [Anoplophora glabripennis]|uniref:DNA replication ATP-dependent helicase/nuclease DNA2 n=1 Tax=Anoplophora glabripennis TaxID=217634 RepID=UPI00087407F5|nr:DNA replication ATP-dependent helicase/nuclease DNA2 [Anoplophora glabripennis]